jgi:dihydroneopterin aldolase
MNDKILLKNMEFYGFHGVFEHERELGQNFYVDLEIQLDLDIPCKTDSLNDTLDYALIFNKVKEATENTRFNLLEALAQHIADTVLSFDLIKKVTVKVKKQFMPIR